MSVNEWSTGAGKSTQGFGGPGILCDGQVAVQYSGYTTNKEGKLVIKRWFDRWNFVQKDDGTIWRKGEAVDAEAGVSGAYQDQDGSWKVKKPDVPLAEDAYGRAYNDFIFLQFRVISPVKWYGAEAVARVKLTGIEFPDGPDRANLYLVTQDMIPALFKYAMALGLKASGFNDSSPAYDATYALPYLRTLEFPLSLEQVFVKVIHPLLMKHAEEGKLAIAEVKTRKKETDTSNFLDQATVQPVPDDDAQRIWAEVTAAEQANQPDSLPPFPGDPVPTSPPAAAPAPVTPPVAAPTQPVMAGVAAPNRGAMEQEVRTLIAAGKATGEQVLGWIDEMGKLPADPNQSALSSLDATGLQAILGKIKGAAPRL